MSSLHITSTQFNNLQLDGRLKQALKDAGFEFCTPIQESCLPALLNGQDIAGQAQTGTGKTATFLLTILNHLVRNPCKGKKNNVRVLVIAPTRELAIQIHADALLLNKYTQCSMALVYGGIDYEKQRKSLESGVEIIIGTPGRLIDYYKQGVFNLKSIEIVVLDEADRMFDLGFIRDIRYLFRRMPKPEKRLSMLFSATLSLRVMELAYEHMNNPEVIKISPDKITTDKVTQTLYHVANEDKIPLLIGLLKHIDPVRTIVFVNTKQTAVRVAAYLEGNHFHAAVLSGEVVQKKRQRLIREFIDGTLPILVATDLAARGLHIPDVSHVINFDLPQNAEDYVHRIGRTARAGARGDAVSFGCEEFVYSLIEIEELLGHKIPVAKLDAKLLVQPEPPVKIKKKRARKFNKKTDRKKNKCKT